MRLTWVATIIAAYEIAFWVRSVDYALSSLSAAKIQQFEVGTGFVAGPATGARSEAGVASGIELSP
jgi:hypothetical protein